LMPEPLHALRIQIKKARYATEFFAGLYDGKKAARRARASHASLRRLQNSLGGLNDITTRRRFCVDIRSRPAGSTGAEHSRHRAFAAGFILGHEQAGAPRLLGRARKAHARFDRAKPFWTQ